MRPAPQEAKTTVTTATQINKVSFVFIVVCFVVCGFSNEAHFIKLQFFQKRGVISSKVSIFILVKILLISLCFLVFLPSFGWTQKTMFFFQKNQQAFPKSLQKITADQQTNNSQKRQKEVWTHCVEQGYFLSQLQLTAQSNEYDSVEISLGQQFEGLQLQFSDATLLLVKQVFPGQSLKNIRRAFKPMEYAQFANEILRYFLNHGYPFCRLYLEKVQMEGPVLRAELKLETGPYYRWTEIHLKNEAAISKNTLQSIIGIQLNDEYNEELLETIAQRVSQTGIFSLKKKSEVLFTKEGAELFVYLQSNRSSSIQGVIGFQPNPLSNQLALTGDVQLKLMNMTKHNESFQFAWRSLQAQTQALKTNLNVPYLFKSPFGLNADFQLYKRDSSFLELKSTMGVQYQFQNGWQMSANYYLNSSSVLSSTGANPMFSKLASLKSNSYGIAMIRRKLDYLPNPRAGFLLQFEGQVGERKNGSTKDVVWKTHATMDYFFPLAQRMTIRTLFQFDTYHAPEIFQNELFRFGGANSLRGFNEETLFATTKAFLSLEWRYLLDKNSHFFVFYNQAYYENSAVSYLKDHPYGFGLGLSAGTNIGIFRMSYALGSQLGNPIQLSAGKIHFGYISYF